MAKKNFYAVKAGRQPGIYKTWGECQKQVTGCKGAQFKGFVTEAEAMAYMQETGQIAADAGESFAGVRIFVDGSYMGGRYSWGFAVYRQQELIFTAKGVGTSQAAAQLHNVAGELQAVIEAVTWAEAQGEEAVMICHDYTGIAEWALGHWQAKLPITAAYRDFMQSRLSWVVFHKVAGHTGVQGNELADQLAKSALMEAQVL